MERYRVIAKDEIIKENNLTEKDYEKSKKEIEKSLYFQGKVMRYSVDDFIKSFKEALGCKDKHSNKNTH